MVINSLKGNSCAHWLLAVHSLVCFLTFVLVIVILFWPWLCSLLFSFLHKALLRSCSIELPQLLTLALQGRLYRALHSKLHATRNLYMDDFLTIHHNCDEYMGVQMERKSTFLTAFEHQEKEARSLFAAQYWYRSCLWMSVSSESSVSNTIPRYLYWSTNFTYWPPNFNNGVAVFFRTQP